MTIAAAILAAAVPGEPLRILGWSVGDLPMLLCLPVLLVLSGFFSGSETALFGFSEAERMSFRRHHPLAERAVAALLADERMLLITVLLGNMAVNVLYFVISSVLMMRSTAGPIGSVVLGAASLLLLVTVGEVGPKSAANAARARFSLVCAPILLTLHRAIAPLRIVIDVGIVAPLSRLTAPHAAPPELHDEELQALLELSGLGGVIEPDEERMLRDVIELRHRRVRDVMTPRIHMVAIPIDASPELVAAVTARHRLTLLPVYHGDLDTIVGMLRVRSYLLSNDGSGRPSLTDPSVMMPVRYVPEISTLEQLLEHFRRWSVKSAIVVDEYGGTEGIVSAEDVVEELVGDIVGQRPEPPVPRLVGLGCWHVSGEYDLRSFSEAFETTTPETKAVTLGALVAEMLGRAPEEGDHVDIGPVAITVEAVARTRATRLGIERREHGEETAEEEAS